MIDWKRIAARWRTRASGSASTATSPAFVVKPARDEIVSSDLSPEAPAGAYLGSSDQPLPTLGFQTVTPEVADLSDIRPRTDDRPRVLEAEPVEKSTTCFQFSDQEATARRLSQVTVSEVVRAGGASVRLTNILSLTDLFDRHTVAEFLDGRPTEAEILRTPNLGRKTYRELRALMIGYAAAVESGEDFLLDKPAAEPPPPPVPPEAIVGLTVADLADQEGFPVRIANRLPAEPALQLFPLAEIFLNPDDARRQLRAMNCIGRKSIEELFVLVGRVAEEQAPDEKGDAGPVDREQAREGVNQALAGLPEKQRFVVTARYGLDGAGPRTLEEVGTEVFVTRERVRQVQKKAMEALARRPWLRNFETFLAAERDEAWRSLVNDSAFLPSADVSTRAVQLDPLVMLAVDVVHDDVSDWLNAFAVVTEGGWLPPGASAESMRDDVVRLREALGIQRLPRALEDFAAAAHMTPDAVEAASAFIPSARVYEGYVHKGHFGSKTRRIARLHRLANTQNGVVADVWRLHVLDTQAAHQDERSARMVFMQMDENPHLFVPLYDDYWLILPGGTDWNVASSVLRTQTLDALDPGFEENSLSRWLWRRLLEAGPMRMSDLRDEALAAMPDIASSSIGAILQTHPVFYRAAPGVFDIRVTRSDGVSPALLSNFQGRVYARALRCGAGRRYFSAWTEEFEWRICAWARWQADPDVFRSLLDVSDPSTWPASEDVRREWLDLRERHGRWLLASERRSVLGIQPPTGAEFLAGLAHLNAFGSIGWIGADRIMQNRLGSKGAADLLALLVAAGAAEAPQDWQSAHAATPVALDLVGTLSQALYRRGSLDWIEPPLTQVLERAASGAARVAWATAPEVVALVEILRGGEGNEITQAPAVALAEAEDLFGSEEWDSLFRD